MIKRIALSWLPVVLWCSLIFYLSGIPNLKTEFGVWDLVLRKAAHLTEYGILFFLVRRALSVSAPEARPSYVTAAALCFSILYAVTDEYHQSFVPGRGPSVVDVGIDAAGAGLGFLSLSLVKKISARGGQECILQ